MKGAAWEDKPYRILFEAYANTMNFEEALKAIKQIKKYDNDKIWDENTQRIKETMEQMKYGGMSFPDFKEEMIRYIKINYGKGCSILRCWCWRRRLW